MYHVRHVFIIKLIVIAIAVTTLFRGVEAGHTFNFLELPVVSLHCTSYWSYFKYPLEQILFILR